MIREGQLCADPKIRRQTAEVVGSMNAEDVAPRTDCGPGSIYLEGYLVVTSRA